MSAAKLSFTHLYALRMHGAHLLSALALASLVACGGGGGGDAASTGVTLKGYAATGVALASASVDIKCAQGTGTATTNASGYYETTLANAVLPCVLKVTNNVAGSNNVTLFSVAAGSGSGAVVANITPLTQLVVANATGNDPAAFFASFNGEQLATISSSNLSSAITKVADELKPIVDISNTNPLTGSLTPATSNSSPNNDPHDLLLEQIKAAIANAGTTLDAVTTSMLPSGNTPQPRASAVLQSQEAKDFAEGLYDIFAEEANGTYGIELHASTGLSNGVYNISHKEWTTSNSGAAWAEGINVSADWFLNASGNWEREPATGTLKQTAPGKFLYTTSLFALNMEITSAPATTLNLATLNSIRATGVIDLPAGSKIFTYGRSVRTADEYRLNSGIGFSTINTLQAFINAYSNANNTLCRNGVCWWFGADGKLNMKTNPTGTWSIETVRGKALLMISLPAEVQNMARLSTGQKYFYALNPDGFVQDGKFSAKDSFDIEDQGSDISLNKVALDAVMKHLRFGQFGSNDNAPVGTGTGTGETPTPTTPSAALLSTSRTLQTSNTSPPSGVSIAAVDSSLASYYQQHCTNSGLQGIYFPAGSTVTSVSASALVGKSFRIATCNLGNPAEDLLTFNANGTITDLGDHGTGSVNTIIRSSSDVAAVFSSNGATEPDGNDTTYLQAYKVTVGGVDKFFIADFESFNGTASYFGWWQEVAK